jgi:hypothetical protein
MRDTQAQKNFAPATEDHQKVEVSVVDETAVVKLFSWVEGLGWSCQKTMGLDASTLEDLHRSIAAARRRINKNTEESHSGNVIKFPAVS